MAGMVRSMKGRMIDMGAIVAANAHVRAVGAGLNVNARGDRLDARGNVIKTVEQVDAEIAAYNRENPNAVRQATLSALEAEVFATPADVFKSEPNMISTPTVTPIVEKPKKKIISSED